MSDDSKVIPIWVVTATTLVALMAVIVLIVMDGNYHRDELKRKIALLEALPQDEITLDDVRDYYQAQYELQHLGVL